MSYMLNWGKKLPEIKLSEKARVSFNKIVQLDFFLYFFKKPDDGAHSI